MCLISTNDLAITNPLPAIAPILELPDEVLAYIVSYLNNRSALAFAGVCQKIRHTYPELALLGTSQEIRYAYSATEKAALFHLLPCKDRLKADITQSLKFINQKVIKKEEETGVFNQYHLILSRLITFDETPSDEELKIYSMLAEQLLQHVGKKARVDAFSKILGDKAQTISVMVKERFARLSRINLHLPLTLNLFTAYIHNPYEKRLFRLIIQYHKGLEKFDFLFNALPDKDQALQFIGRFFLRHNCSVLHFAIEQGCEDIAEALLEIHPPSIEIVDLEKCPLLITAVLQRNVKLVENLLVKFKADINAQDKEGKTALIHATRQKNGKMCNLLQEHGAIIPLSDQNGDTALTLAQQ